MGKSASRTVYDFLWSLDWGLCHGPVDRINQIWVKDKPIWCGDASERKNVIVDQPELFGGDDAEGGVLGTVEVYTGTDDQVSSAALSARPGRTPANMPGYRGLAHLFFRGWASAERPSFFNLDGEVTGSDMDVKAPGSGHQSGFRWGTNNPYLPKMKASVTRLSATLGEAFKEIYPITGVREDGSFIPAELYVVADSNAQEIATEGGPPGSGGALMYGNVIPKDNWALEPGDDDLMIDLLTIFPSQAEIDAAFANGTISFTCRLEGYCNDLPNFGGPGPGQIQTIMGMAIFRDNGSGQPDLADNRQSWSSTNLVTGAVNWSITPPGSGSPIAAHTGIRFVRMRVYEYTTSSLQSLHFDNTLTGTFRQTLTINYEQLGIGHCQVDGELGALPNANPSHMLHECLTNAEWGKGEDPSMVDAAAFLAMAETLHDEFFGLSMPWIRQATIEEFSQEVLDHIRAVLFQDPATGLWTPRLLRGGYSTDGLLTLDQTNATLTDRKRRAWGETINEIVVSYTDPATEEEATVTAHDLGNISIQGGVISETRDYYGIRDPFLAQQVADRDVAEAAYPLFSCTAQVNRKFWTVRPGDVVKVTWPEDGISEMICRVTSVDYGEPTDREISLSLVEDIFSVERTTYSQPQGSLWDNEAAPTEALDHEAAITAPLPTLLRTGLALADIDADYPGVGVLLLGDATPRPIDVQAHTSVPLGNGSSAIQSVTSFPISRSVVTDAVLAPEPTSTFNGDLMDDLFAGAPEVGNLAMLGSGEAGSEIVMLDSYDTVADTWTVIRGLWDTIPGTWAVGTRLWQFPDGGLRSDPTERAAGETIVYRYLPRGAAGRLPYNDAADVSLTASERPHMPFRPANVQLDGNGFGITQYNDFATYPTEITATWANRNRTNEDAVALKWDAANATPETGQTTVLRFLNDQGVFQHELTGLTGTSRAITIAEFQGVQVGFIEFLSERDGIRSWTGARRAFDIRLGGYGVNYGNFYGP